MGDNSGAGVSSLTYDQMLLEEEQWNELFVNNKSFLKDFQVTSQKDKNWKHQ